MLYCFYRSSVADLFFNKSYVLELEFAYDTEVVILSWIEDDIIANKEPLSATNENCYDETVPYLLIDAESCLGIFNSLCGVNCYCEMF